MQARCRYHIRHGERLEIREGDETELVTWPVLSAHYFTGLVAAHFNTPDGETLVEELSSWDERYGWQRA